MLFVCIVLYRLKAFWPHKEGNYFLFKFYNFYEYSPTFMVWTFRAKTTQIKDQQHGYYGTCFAALTCKIQMILYNILFHIYKIYFIYSTKHF